MFKKFSISLLFVKCVELCYFKIGDNMENKTEKIIKIVIYSLQIVMSCVFAYLIYETQFIPMDYMIGGSVALIGLLIGEYFLIFYKKSKSKRSIITQVLSVILSVLLIVGSTYVYQMGAVVDLLGTKTFQQRAISMIVLKDSPIRNQEHLEGSRVGYVSSIDQETMQFSMKTFEKEVGKLTYQSMKDFHQLVEKLYDKDVDAVILDEAFRSLIQQDYEHFQEDTRVVYQIVKDEGVVHSKSVDVTEKPFLVYVSGNDEYGEMTTISRSDVNMLVAVNPNTHQILLVSIPRDTYYPLHRNGQYDKFTHTGVYGLQESIDTLQDMMSEDINYYVRMNFTSFMNIVDALGGITVDSPHDFITKIGKYHIQKGENTLNAHQALAFVRERKSFLDGDFERGRNQQRMIKAIIEKVCSSAILTSFSSVLDAVSESIETSMSADEMNALVQFQLSKMPHWDVQTYQLSGVPASMPCYSMGGVSASVVQVYESSIQQARDYIDTLMNNQTVQVKAK